MSKKFVGDALLYLFGLLLNRGVGFLLLPVYTSYLSVDEYGINAICTTLILVLGMTFTLSLEAPLTILYYKIKEEEAKDLLVMISLSVIVLPLLLTTFLSFFGEPLISRFIPNVPWNPYLRMSIWVAFLGIPQLLPQAILRIRHQAGLNSLFNFASFAFSTSLILYFLIYKGEGVVSILKGQIISGIVFTVISIFLCARWSQKWMERRIRFSLWLRAYKIGLGYFPHILSIWVLNVSDRWILNYFVPIADIGIYNIAYTLGMIVHLFGAGLSSVYGPLYFQQSQEPSFRERFTRLLSGIILVFSWVTLAVSVSAPEILQIMTPPAYHRAADYVPWIAAGYWFSVSIYQVGFTVIENQGKSHLSVLISVPAALLNIILNWIFIPQFGILAASVNTLLAFVLMAGLSLVISRRYDKLSFPWIAIIKLFAISIVIFWMTFIFTDDLLLMPRILIKSGLLVFAGVAMIYITGFDLSIVRQLLKKEKNG